MREYHKQVLLGLKFLLSRGLPLVLVSAATAGVFLLKTPNSAKQASAPGARDPNATVGQYEGKSEAEIQAKPNLPPSMSPPMLFPLSPLITNEKRLLP